MGGGHPYLNLPRQVGSSFGLELSPAQAQAHYIVLIPLRSLQHGTQRSASQCCALLVERYDYRPAIGVIVHPVGASRAPGRGEAVSLQGGDESEDRDVSQRRQQLGECCHAVTSRRCGSSVGMGRPLAFRYCTATRAASRSSSMASSLVSPNAVHQGIARSHALHRPSSSSSTPMVKLYVSSMSIPVRVRCKPAACLGGAPLLYIGGQA